MLQLIFFMVCALKFEGQLSQRMQIPGNMWLEVWQSARPIPARRQRRLFDDTKEAEKVICTFSTLQESSSLHILMGCGDHTYKLADYPYNRRSNATK